MSELDRFVVLDRRIDAADDEGIRARWEFGRELLARRVGKQLPKGLLDEVARATGKSRRELGYRMMLAERAPTETELCNVVANFGSWHEIANRALPRTKKPPVATPALPPEVYSTIVADPPWDVEAGGAEWGGGASSNAQDYATMTVEAIVALPVADLAADDAHLYLWTINRYVTEAYDVARAWGFEPSTLLTWCKKPHGLGLGGAYVLTTEFVLFARRGTPSELKRIPSSWFDWPRRRHSVKPGEFFTMVEQVSPGPYLELFNRGGRPGWAVWGEEAKAA